MTAPPPAAPAGAPPPPAPDTKTAAAAAVQSFLPFINNWGKIDAKETRDMLERLLVEKTAQEGSLQGPWATANELLTQARQEWESPTGDPYTPLIAACFVIQKHPVPAATQPPAQDSTTPTWGNFPASLPGSAQEKVTPPSPDDKEVRNLRKQVAHLETATKRARRLAVVAFVVAVISSALGLIVNLVRWIATSPSWVVAIITAVGAFIIGVFASGRVADWFKKRR